MDDLEMLYRITSANAVETDFKKFDDDDIDFFETKEKEEVKNND